MIKVWDASSGFPKWIEREKPLSKSAQLEEEVRAIIEEVKARGDAALLEFTRKFDGASLTNENLKVNAEEIKEAYEKVSKEQVSAIKKIKQRLEIVEKFTLKQAETEIDMGEIYVKFRLRPIESVGCYVPGGKASYPSTLVMTVVPAKLAGVPRVLVCTPPNADGTVNPLTLVAADICRADEIYRVGGAQAIAAMAYGTETIKPVKKVVGPGNKYVTMAKILVSRDVSIDMPAGPSELLVIADETADPRFIALDMCSQAEHGPDSIVGLVTTSREIAEKVLSELEKIAYSSPRSNIIADVLSNNGFVIVGKTVDDMVNIANAFAPEHVEVITKNSEQVAEKLYTAGLILIGPYSPASLSDYYSGTNHVLPTGGFGRTFSGLSSLDFVRRVAIVSCSKEGLLKVLKHIKVLAEAENLQNHYRAVRGRFKVEGS
ncbi:MAG: histidinol dehydrogenase [Nitrososphaerota archaeon]|nr:histidinol dehydrogenase [Candidatus Bathyarchaeota archaeon]MDW8022309.1 histidinol dehydrogenase [Nitrososphaerota archaeon]